MFLIARKVFDNVHFDEHDEMAVMLVFVLAFVLL
jgi:hypothetical protein